MGRFPLIAFFTRLPQSFDRSNGPDGVLLVQKQKQCLAGSEHRLTWSSILQPSNQRWTGNQPEPSSCAQGTVPTPTGKQTHSETQTTFITATNRQRLQDSGNETPPPPEEYTAFKFCI